MKKSKYAEYFYSLIVCTQLRMHFGLATGRI